MNSVMVPFIETTNLESEIWQCLTLVEEDCELAVYLYYFPFERRKRFLAYKPYSQ